MADGLPGVQKAEILQLCDEVEDLSRRLSDLCAAGKGDTPEAHEVARKLSQKLHELKERINSAVVNRVVEDFIDIVTPLKQFTEAVLAPEGTPNRDQNFSDKACQKIILLSYELMFVFRRRKICSSFRTVPLRQLVWWPRAAVEATRN